MPLPSCYEWQLQTNCGNSVYRFNPKRKGVALLDVRGLGLSGVTLERELAVGRDGSTLGNSRNNERIIELDIAVCGSCCDEFETLRDELIQAIIGNRYVCNDGETCIDCNGCQFDNGFAPLQLSYVFCGSGCLPERRCIDVAYSGPSGEATYISDKNGRCWIQTLQFVMPYPFAHNCCPEPVCISLADAEYNEETGKYNVCTDLPYSGDTPSYPRIEFFNSVTNPTITMNDGTPIPIDYSTIQGEVLDLNTWHGQKYTRTSFGQNLSVIPLDACYESLLLRPNCDNTICIEFDEAMGDASICISYWEWYQLI